MDSKQFDELTKHLSTGTDRRRVLKGLFGGVAAAGMAVLGRGTVDAAKGGGGSSGEPSVAKQCAAYCSREGGPGSGAAYSLCKQECQRNGGPPTQLTCSPIAPEDPNPGISCQPGISGCSNPSYTCVALIDGNDEVIGGCCRVPNDNS